jgi:hypothetical protein
MGKGIPVQEALLEEVTAAIYALAPLAQLFDGTPDEKARQSLSG